MSSWGTGRYGSLWPRQAARGGANVAASAANFGVVGVFNNSSGDKLLVIRDFNFLFITAFGAFLVQQGTAGLATKPGSPMVAGDPAPMGQIVSGTVAALPANQDYFSFTNWPHDFPLAVLQPGWGAYFYTAAVNSQIVVGYVWDFIDAADLATLREKIEDAA